MPCLQQKYRTLHYLLRGRGEPLLLIHGLGSSGAVDATNASLISLFTDQLLPSAARCACDEPQPVRPLTFSGSLAEEHAMGP